MPVICEQHRDGVPDDYVVEVQRDKHNPDETDAETLERKLAGAEYHGWQVERTSETEFHAWKEYGDGDGTIEAPNRKDRYFRIVP